MFPLKEAAVTLFAGMSLSCSEGKGCVFSRAAAECVTVVAVSNHGVADATWSLLFGMLQEKEGVTRATQAATLQLNPASEGTHPAWEGG
jgi:hypothetical protein